jgi:hypothetical protein
MTEKRLILILTILIILLCIGTVNATEVTMRVDSKHIIGSGLGNSPLDLESCINVVYVISERQMDGGTDKYIVQEYPVGIQDYCKIQKGQTVTLEVPDSRLSVCKVVKIV